MCYSSVSPLPSVTPSSVVVSGSAPGPEGSGAGPDGSGAGGVVVVVCGVKTLIVEVTVLWAPMSEPVLRASVVVLAMTLTPSMASADEIFMCFIRFFLVGLDFEAGAEPEDEAYFVT